MKPELANLFTINTTGHDADIVLSFYYEWQEWCEVKEGISTELKKQKVASVVLDLSDAAQLAEKLNGVLTDVKKQLSQVNRNE